MNRPQKIPSAALALGLGGLIPFIASSVMVWFPLGLPAAISQTPTQITTQITTLDQHTFTHALLAYGAVILSFLGGIKWGTHVMHEHDAANWSLMSLSVLPSLIAWTALLLDQRMGLFLLIAGIVGQYFLDRRSVVTGQLPDWFGRLRLILTSVATAALVLALVKLLFQ